MHNLFLTVDRTKIVSCTYLPLIVKILSERAGSLSQSIFSLLHLKLSETENMVKCDFSTKRCHVIK